MFKILKKVFSVLSQAKVVLDIAVPVLEAVINKDINNDGKIGK